MQIINKSMLITVVLLSLAAGTVYASKSVLGYVEYIYLQPWDFRIKSKLDTGAKTSSIYAVNIEPFEKDDEKWVRFTLPFEQDEKVDPIEVEKKVKRAVLIKRKVGDSIRRYVVNFEICLSGKTITSEFSLANREGFVYSVLLGRNTLKHNAIVDPAEAFLAGDECADRGDS